MLIVVTPLSFGFLLSCRNSVIVSSYSSFSLSLIIWPGTLSKHTISSIVISTGAEDIGLIVGSGGAADMQGRPGRHRFVGFGVGTGVIGAAVGNAIEKEVGN